jgi:hypothetical protein
MKKQNKLHIKVRDLEPLKDVIAGRRRHAAHARAGAFREPPAIRGEYGGGLGLIGYNRIP